MARGLSTAGVLLILIGLGALILLPGSPFRITPEEGGPAAAPQLSLTSLAEGTCPTFSLAGSDCATGVTEISTNLEARTVVLTVTADSSADTLAPDSFAVALGLRCQSGCTRVQEGASVETPIGARFVGLSTWVVRGNTSDVEIFGRAAGLAEGEKQVGWTGADGTTFLGQEDGGALWLASDGETASVTFGLRLNPNIPNVLPDGGEVYVLKATLEVYSVVGGTPISVALTMTLTVNT